MIVVACDGNGHEITPKPGTARRIRDGQPASLLNPADYPVEAVCVACGQPIRIERFFLAEWRHITAERDR